MGRKPLRSLFITAALFIIAVMAVLPGCGKKKESVPAPKAPSSIESAEKAAGTTEAAPPVKPAPEEKEEERPLKVGVIGPATGEESEIGAMTFEGAELAAEALKASGGINGSGIELVRLDNKGDAEATKEGVKRLISENVAAIIAAPTGWSTFTPVYLANESRTIFISAGTKRHIGSSGPFIFRMSLPVEGAADELVGYSVKEGLKGFFFITVMEDEALNLGAALRRAAESNGAEIRGEATVFSESDLAGTVGAMKAGMPFDAVLFAGGPEMAVKLLKEAKKAGLRLPLVGGDELYDERFLKAGALAEGSILYTGFFAADKDPATAAFVEAYKRKKGKAPSQFAAEAYDAFMVLASSISEAGTRPGRLRDGLMSIKGFQGATGTIDMTEGRESRRPPYILKVVKKGGSYSFSPVREAHRRP